MRGLREEQMRSRKGEGTEGGLGRGLKNLNFTFGFFCLSCCCEFGNKMEIIVFIERNKIKFLSH